MDDFQEYDQDTDELRPHHEEGTSSQLHFLRNVQNMSDSILQVGNPFQEEEKELVSYMGVCSCPYHYLKLSNNVTRLDDLSVKIIRRPYWKIEHLTFRLQSKSTNRSGYAKQQPRRNYLTSRIIRRCLYHCTHVKETYASSLNMIEADSAEGPDTEQMTELPPTGYNAIIIDGGALIHMMPPKTCLTFDDYVANVFYPCLRVELKACDRRDVIWDRYFPKVSKVAHVTRQQMELAVGHVNARTPGKRSW